MRQKDIGLTATTKGRWPSRAQGPCDSQDDYEDETTVLAIQAAIESHGHRCRILGDGREALEVLLTNPPEFVFNIAEGRNGPWREATMAAFLEALDVPYSHSDPRGLLISHDKHLAKTIVAAAGLRTPTWTLANPNLDDGALSFPVIAKPNHEGMSIGITSAAPCHSLDELVPRVAYLAAAYRQPILVEEFCPGNEYTVTVIGHGESARVLGDLAFTPSEEMATYVTSFDNKYTRLLDDRYRSPAPLAPDRRQALHSLAIGVHNACSLRDISRVDIREDRSGQLSFLEVNALPGLNPERSLSCLTARAHGVTVGVPFLL